MGNAALNLTEGIPRKTGTAIMKLLLLTVFVAFALAEEAAEEAKPEAPAAVVKAVHPFYGLWGHQLQWPGIRAPGFSGTCWGCRAFGKRSADEAAPAPVFGSGHNSSVGRTIWGFRGKRSAEPGYFGYPYGFYGYPYYHALKPLKSGTAVHPGHATSFVSSSGASPI